jgi:hypothetical protein
MTVCLAAIVFDLVVSRIASALSNRCESTIWKSVQRFSEKIMPKQ